VYDFSSLHFHFLYDASTSKMNLEALANELLLDLFECLDAVHLFHAFSGLNARFDNLLLIHFQSYHFDFRLVTKSNFEDICQKYLPAIVDRIILLHLTNSNKILNTSHFFLSHDFTLDHFNHLQSLSLYDTNSFDLLHQLIYQCRCLPQLTHLNIIKCYLCGNNTDTSDFINNI
jgi:hypothetical protein